MAKMEATKEPKPKATIISLLKKYQPIKAMTKPPKKAVTSNQAKNFAI